MRGNFITVRDSEFILNEKIFRFIGCNMYELANVDSAVTEAMMKDAAEAGFKVVRFWAFEPMKKDKLLEICKIAGAYNLKIIPVLSDMTGFLQSYKIERGWFTDGYKKNYLKYVVDIAENFKDKNEILLWELINEPVAETFEEIYNFAKDVSGKIKQADPNHLISIGTIGGIGDKFGNFFSRFKASNFEKLYSINSLDAVSLHDYSFNSTVFERLDILYRLKGKHKNSQFASSLGSIINFFPDVIDKLTLKKFSTTIDFPFTIRNIWRAYNRKNIEAAKSHSKPIYIGEIGFKKNLGELREKIIGIELKKYFDAGASGILLWSFEAQGKSLDGHDYGFDKSDGLVEVVNKLKH